MSEIVLEPSSSSSPEARSSEPVLEVEDLTVTFDTDEGRVQAVRGVNLQVYEHEVLGIVGESGSGKSVTMLAVMGLLPRTADITGSARFRGRELLGDGAKGARSLRGGKMAMIFQDPLTALNPVHRVGDQIAEAVEAHRPDLSGKQANSRAIEMLELVGIPQPATRARQYPHEFSGGMRQRAMIAMAISNDPDLLIADEPTTALDVTIQAQILEVLQTVQEATSSAIVFITHDLGVIARLATRVQVMYAGRVAELSPVDTIFTNSCHPYTRGLLGSLPKLDEGGHEELRPIPGSPPSMVSPPAGCAFHPRCAMSQPICLTRQPELRLVGADGQQSACHMAEDLENLESPTDVPDVSELPNRVLTVEDEALNAEEVAVVKQGGPRLRPAAIGAFLLGLLTAVLAVLMQLNGADPDAKGIAIMLAGLPAVWLGTRAIIAIKRAPKVLRGRTLVNLGLAMAYIPLVMWFGYCFFWLLANTLPEAKP
jgi:oligopeptide/dipeptide ABC transporter ATP-binding protein